MGCELSFAIQNEKRFDEEREQPATSHDDERKLMLAITACVARSFVDGRGALPMVAVREALHLPTRIASKLLQRLVDADILNEVRCDDELYDVAYAPARDVSRLRVCDVLYAVDGVAEGRHEDICRATLARRAEKSVDALKGVAKSSEENRYILELTNDDK